MITFMRHPSIEAKRPPRKGSFWDRSFQPEKKRGTDITIYTGNAFRVLQEIIDYILDFFSDENTLFVLETPLNDELIFIDWKRAQNADELRFTEGTVSSENYVRIVDDLFKKSEKKKILLLNVMMPDAENVHWLRLPPLRRFSTNCSDLIAPEMFFHQRAEYIVLNSSRLVTSYHLNAFIKTWLATCAFHRNLYVFHLRIGYPSPRLDVDEVVAGLQLLDFEEGRRPERDSIPIRAGESWEEFEFEALIEKDIVRYDGKLATLAMSNSEFLFVVWDNRTLLDPVSLSD